MDCRGRRFTDLRTGKSPASQHKKRGIDFMIDPIAYTETYYIINKMSDTLRNKIPKDL